jgi:alpha-1,3-rhamnosyl/mannosyltransferase
LPTGDCRLPGLGDDAVHQRLQVAQAKGWLRYLGFVPHKSLPPLMAGARLFAYPSLYEGFGLPVLEAMACGVPVLCSNASTLPEVAANAAAMHEPLDTDALYELLQRGLSDDDWADELRAAGLKRAGAFSWARCCSETIEAYRHAAAQ